MAQGSSSGPEPSKTTPEASLEVDTSKPGDFEGTVQTTNEIPSPETLKKIEDFLVLDRHGKSHAFKTLYSGTNVARRVLVIFIRHFFCGQCQDYVTTLSEAIAPESLLSLPVSTFVVIIGCGDPGLIDDYAKTTNCHFPIYTDPKRSLFDALGMKKSLDAGTTPGYARRSLLSGTIASISQGLAKIPKGLAFKGGDFQQVGGEFLFEPSDLVTPVSSPRVEATEEMKSPSGEPAQQSAVEEKKVTWCHRMKMTRDHCEIPELMEILGVDAKGLPVKNQEKWAATIERKGTGSSMAKQMSELTAAKEEGKA